MTDLAFLTFNICLASFLPVSRERRGEGSVVSRSSCQKMDFLRGKLRTQTSSLLSDDGWRTRSSVRRREEILSSTSRLNSYKSSLSASHNKYSSYSPSPLRSPSLARTRKLSVTNSALSDDVRNTKNRFRSSHDSSLSLDDTPSVNYKELYEQEKKEKEVGPLFNLYREDKCKLLLRDLYL